MPKVTTETIDYKKPNGGIAIAGRIDISVDSEGWFYCYPNTEWLRANNGVLQSECGVRRMDGRKKQGCFGALDMPSLLKWLHKLAQLINEPEKKVTYVILYNIESNISFALNDCGKVFPNASYPDAKWPTGEVKKAFGDLHSSHIADGGYNMKIGAVAYKRTTYKYGDTTEIKHERWYGVDADGNELVHGNNEHPAAVLNSWCAFSLPRQPMEMPYTDEAARFFHGLITSMSSLQYRIQQMMADREAFLKLVNSGGNLLAGPETHTVKILTDEHIPYTAKDRLQSAIKKFGKVRIEIGYDCPGYQPCIIDLNAPNYGIGVDGTTGWLSDNNHAYELDLDSNWRICIEDLENG